MKQKIPFFKKKGQKKFSKMFELIFEQRRENKRGVLGWIRFTAQFLKA